MKKVYTSENSFLVHNMKNLIEAQGVEVIIKNEFAQGAVGEISAFDSWPEVWVVNDGDFECALNVVKSLQDQKGGEDWTCKHCSEENDASFEVCWNCQQERS